MKKAFKRAAIGLALAVTFLGAVEWNGYHFLDRKDGTNVISETLKDSRQLTKGEIELARGVFGDSIDYSKVRVFKRPWMVFFGSQNQIITPNGNIYVADKDYHDDFSDKADYAKTMFIHEMTHVWQSQHGVAVRWEAVKGWLSSGFKYGSTYKYELDAVKDFKDLNIEQQAELVETYYSDCESLREMGPREKLWSFQQARFDEERKEMEALESKIGDNLPLPARLHLDPPPPPDPAPETS
jgi:hypothetical protein